MKTVAEVMTHDVETVPGDWEIHELEKLLIRKRIHGVPVVDEDQRLVGVISQTDLLAWHYMVGVDGATFYDYTNLLLPGESDFRGLQLSDVRTATVAEVMSPVIHTVEEHDTVREAAERMIEHRVHRLLVVDANKRVRGLVSAIDLLHAVPGVEAVGPHG